MQANATIITVERLKNSVNGNPRYEVLIRTTEDKYVRGKTASDSSFVYSLPRSDENVFCTWHITKGGKVVFDDIEKV